MTESEERGPETTGPTIRDRRRIDPTTFQVREPQETAAPSAGEAGAAPYDTGRPGTTSDSGTRNMTHDQGASATPGAGATPQPETGRPETGQPVDSGQSVSADQQDETTAQIEQLQAQVGERTADLQRLQAEYVNYKRRVDRDRDLVRTVAVEGVLRELLPVLDNIALAREHGELTGGFKAVAEELGKVAQRHGLEPFGEPGDPFDPNIHDALMHAHADDITGPTCVQILQAGYRAGERVLRPASVAVAEPADEPSAAPQPEQHSEPTEGTASSDGTSDDTTTG